MPRIPDQLQHSIAFLYTDAESACSGVEAGGTGFVVSVTTKSGRCRTFLVTNIHVIGQGAGTARVTCVDGSVLLLQPKHWTYHIEGDDVAVALLSSEESQRVSAINWTEVAATAKRLGELNAGVGDDVFMLGRFVSLTGKQKNSPLARFGTIAMMPGELVVDGRGCKVEAFLVEMRSLSGFSGSPVFIYMGPGTYRGDGRMMPFYSEQIGLIGIDTGHFQLKTSVLGDASGFVNLNSGVSIVAPVWKIGETLSEALDGEEIVFGV